MSLPRPYYDEGGITLYHSDCREVLPLLSGLAACVTDPPYELGFMGKRWDAQGIAYSLDVWRGVLGALKPGAHLLAFGGTRTHHRMVCAVEDAGFEIRDEMQWLYGSGFPKSLDIGKAIDKAAGAEREVVGKRTKAGDITGGAMHAGSNEVGVRVTITETAPATAEAKQWDGWGTALKPACEPICVARKPLDGTVAANVLKHGTGGINVDGCRVGAEERPVMVRTQTIVAASSMSGESTGATSSGEITTKGRWPSNVLLSHAPGCVCTGEAWDCVEGCPVKLLDQQSGESVSKSGGITGRTGNGLEFGMGTAARTGHDDSGGASRFFYTAKASRSERGNDNTHPTVKPLDLMTYLCRLVTPPGGIVLDPFSGSGTTLLAARRLGFRAIGIELDAAHCEIIASRLAQGALLL